MEQNFFPQRPTVTPTIYAYRLLGVDSHKGYLKVGYTDRTAKERIDEQLHTSKIRYEIVLTESAMTNDGSCFTDKNVHKLLERKGFHSLRHTFATRCIEAGADCKTVSEILGHSTVNMTLNLYVHPQMEQKRRCVNMLK